ncbi:MULTISPECIES: MFS transporter [Heyndrickxia]|uniref:MFS transporter n=1 Tax=Heyndrickxia TaxID=2837504 RepID=UPI00242E9182|nr:MFS transporter [Heyndrickxia oleronia]MCI1591022.1 MFS transporter [Heyndrickxia oleronia]MCI1613081.1 MFS transporter [Heyndrickxia oleronia]MCI1761029.1 MFS transporter [Heyndrickxia oleronia]
MKLNKNFSLLLLGQSLANIGDVLYTVSVISAIFVLTGSATVSSFVPFTITTSMFISSLLTPLLVGKVNLKWLLAGSQIGKTILLFILGFMLVGITVSNYYLIFLIIGWIAFLDGCANPIRQTLIPHYVKPESLIQANGIAETVTQVIQAVMWFIGSLFLIFMSPQQLVWLVGGLFIIASVLLCLIESVIHKTTEPKRKLEQIKEGWKTLSNTPVLRRIAWIDFFETIAGTVWIAAILYVFVNDALNVDEKWWGFINGTFFLGLILGSVYCIKYPSIIEKNLGTFIFVGSFGSSLITILFSLNSIPIFALLLSLGIGLFGQIKNIPQQTVIQTSVSKEQLATVYTSLGAIGTGIFGISSLIMGILADLLGIRTVFMISGLLIAVVGSIVHKNKQLFVTNVEQQ